jgi:hypothetical protein
MKKLQPLIFFQTIIAALQASDLFLVPGKRVQVLFSNNGNIRVQPL